MQLYTDRYSLSLCTLDTPYVHVVSCNLIFCCVIQSDRTLLRASFRGHTEIVAMLLKFGADFSIVQQGINFRFFKIPATPEPNVQTRQTGCQNIQPGLINIALPSVTNLAAYI